MAAKKGRKQEVLVNDIKVTPVRMVSQEIGPWKKAIDSARSPTSPKRKLLYELYDNIKIDGQLLSVMEKRKMGTTNKRVMFQPDEGTDTVDEKISKLILETPWFYKMRQYAADAKAFGHSLIELVPAIGAVDDRIIDRVELIPRSNVLPEKNFVAFDASDDTKGIYYAGEQADPAFSQYLISVGDARDYGLLMTAAQYVIYKRGAFGDWSQFAELFGMPFRAAFYNPHDNLMRQKLEEGLASMGGAGYAVLPEGAKLEFFNNVSTGQADIFKNLVEQCNAEISKIFLGQTMTTDNGSSRSQSETHKGVEEDINMADMIESEYLLNWDFKSKMQAISGINALEKGMFRYPQTIHIPLEKRWEMDIELSRMIPVSDEYFYKTYGIEKPAEGATIVVPPKKEAAAPVDPAKKPAKKKLNSSAITTLYKGACTHCMADFETLAAKDLDKEAGRLAKLIYHGKLKTGKIDQKLLKETAKVLTQAVTKGYDIVAKGDLTDQDKALLKQFTENLYTFSSAKTHDEIKAANALVYDAKGDTRPFSQFEADFFKLHKVYNRNHLAAEYNHVVATGQMGANWQRLDKDGMGKYETAGDERVRDAHKALDGVILPWSDNFWKMYYPPNGWGCRCDAYSTETGEKTSMKDVALPELKAMFKGNAGITGEVFTKEHPYFDVSKSEMSKINTAAKEANE